MLVSVSCISPLPPGRGTALESGPFADCTHSRLAASPSPLPVLARAATRQATSPIAITTRAPRGGRESSAEVPWGAALTARQYWNRSRNRPPAIPRPPFGVRSPRGRESHATEDDRGAAQCGRGPRAADELHRSRFRPGAAADPRDGGDLRQLGS